MKKLIIANWKMNPGSVREARKMFLALKAGLKNNRQAEVVVCPPFVYLQSLAETFGGRKKIQLRIGAQNCFWEEKGAFTGEISPKMLKDLGVKYVILGHSERVMIMAETNEMTAKKVNAVLKLGLTPIICIGETLAERKSGKTAVVLQKELAAALKNDSRFKIQDSRLIVAYEPLWAIGTGKACSAKDAAKAREILKQIIKKIAGQETTAKVPILYGGSVNSQNAAEYLGAGMDGLLIGGASLNPKEFLAIVKQIR